jgi:hypothetical protein
MPSTEELTSVKAGPRSASGGGKSTAVRPQTSCTSFEDHVAQAEGDQQLGHMAELVHAAQAVALEQGAQQPDHQRRDDQRRPEADQLAIV